MPRRVLQNCLMMKNDNAKIRFERRFLLADLPAPLERKDQHLQYFDNFLTQTRLILRRIRTPETKEWQYRFVQQDYFAAPDFSRFQQTEINLNQYEYEVLAIFENNELRFNSYLLPLADGTTLEIQMFLNRELWNLIIARVEFADENAMQSFAPPEFLLQEITNDAFFTALNLSDANLEEVRAHLFDRR